MVHPKHPCVEVLEGSFYKGSPSKFCVINITCCGMGAQSLLLSVHEYFAPSCIRYPCPNLCYIFVTFNLRSQLFTGYPYRKILFSTSKSVVAAIRALILCLIFVVFYPRCKLLTGYPIAKFLVWPQNRLRRPFAPQTVSHF